MLATGRKQKAVDANESVGTVEYARRFGAIAVDIECGQHKDPLAPGIAYAAIRNCRCAITGNYRRTKARNQTAGKNTQLVTMSHVYYRDDEGRFPKSWKHLEPVKEGEPMALRADGSPLLAPRRTAM